MTLSQECGMELMQQLQVLGVTDEKAEVHAGADVTEEEPPLHWVRAVEHMCQR